MKVNGTFIEKSQRKLFSKAASSSKMRPRTTDAQVEAAPQYPLPSRTAKPSGAPGTGSKASRSGRLRISHSDMSMRVGLPTSFPTQPSQVAFGSIGTTSSQSGKLTGRFGDIPSKVRAHLRTR